MKAVFGFIPVLWFLFCFSFAKPVFAATFSFSIASTSATTISSGNQDVDVNLSISNLPSGDSYFRVALQKENGSYFGYIKNNNGDWSAIQLLSGDCIGYYKSSDTSITSLTLKFKIGDDAIVDNGTYSLKAHRFTSTCKSYSEATNNSSLIIALPTSTPTSTPTPTPNPTSIPTPTPTSSLASTPTPIPTKTPTPIPTANTPTLKTSVDPTLELSSPAVLGQSTGNGLDISPPENNLALGTAKKPDTIFQGIAVILGIVLMAICGILTFRIIKKGELIQNEEE